MPVDSFSTALVTVQVTVGLAVFLFLLRRAPQTLSRRQAAVFGCGWVIAATAELWIFGTSSFLDLANGAGVAVPTQKYLLGLPGGALFGQAAAGGNDLDALLAFTGQYVSLERLLLALPLPLALALHALFVSGVAYLGAYRVARAMAAGRRAATALACIHVVAHSNYLTDTWSHGLSYAIMPLAIHLAVLRHGRPYHILGVLLAAGLYAVSSIPTHSLPAVLVSISVAALWFGWRLAARVIVSQIVFVVVVAANWHESLFAKLTLAPLTLRGSTYSWAASDLGQFLDGLIWGGKSPVLWPLCLLALILLRRSRADWLRGAAILAATLCLGQILSQIPWHSLPGLGMLAGLNLHHASFAAIPLAVLVTAHACAGAPVREVRLAAIAILALTIGTAASLKAYHLSTMLSEGGAGVLAAAERVDRQAMADAEPSRAVAVPYRLSGNMFWPVGIDTIDGCYNLVLSPVIDFWNHGILPRDSGKDLSSGFINLEIAAFDGKCCESYQLSRFADLDMLRIANVGWVMSLLPLHGDGLVQVGGPTGEAPVRNTVPLVRRIMGYVQQLFSPPGVRIYRLDGSLPRLYGASAIIAAAPDMDKTALAALIRTEAPNRKAVIVGAAASSYPAGSATVVASRLSQDRIEAELDAPQGGAVIVNMPHTPFWTAVIDGVPAETSPANLIQTVVAIPPGARHLDLRYGRKRLRDRIDFP